MSTSSSNNKDSAKAKKKHPLQHLIAGGCAGLVESSVCHPLDTIKTRMQLRRQTATVEKAVVKMRHSLVEPAMRFSHSLSEPAAATSATAGINTNTATRHASSTALHEPGLHLRSTAAAATLPSGSHGGVVPSHATVLRAPPPGVVQATLGPFGTAKRIVQREGFLALYKGLTAVYTGIVPKMAIRFVSFEQYRDWGTALATSYGGTGIVTPTHVTFCAGLASGLTEAILVVTPAEVCKIRMQSQYHSMMDPAQLQQRKYTNVVQTAMVIAREEGVSALYKGVVPTMLRQGCNQAVNFTAYSAMKQRVLDWQGTNELAPWQSLLMGGLSGGMGPLVNNPLDVVKTRLQKQIVVTTNGVTKPPKYTGLAQACTVIARDEGVLALWKGITPRLMRIMPGQAITFMTYEAVSSRLSQYGLLPEV